MNKTNSNTVKYGLVYKNHGKWSRIPADVLTAEQIRKMAGREARNLPINETFKAFTTVAAQLRKQPAKLIKLTA